MSQQDVRRKAAPQRTDDSTPEQAPGTAGVSEHGRRLVDEMDDLLDEIDEVLETNAEEFVRSYVQKGGE